MGCDKLPDKHLMDGNGCRPVNPVSQTIKGWLTVQARIPFHGSLKGRISSQIIQIFISLAQDVDPLSQQG